MTDHGKSDVSKMVRVKPLEWEVPVRQGFLFVFSMAGIYRISALVPDEVWLDLNGTGIGGRHHSVDLAKAAAQADFERRILACIEPQVQP